MLEQQAFVIHVDRPVTCKYKEQRRLWRFLKTQGAVAFFPSGIPIEIRLDTGKGSSSIELLLAQDCYHTQISK
jgi:hypothetical protein